MLEQDVMKLEHLWKIQIINSSIAQVKNIDTVEPAHAVTSIKQSPVLKGHIFLVLS